MPALATGSATGVHNRPERTNRGSGRPSVRAAHPRRTGRETPSCRVAARGRQGARRRRGPSPGGKPDSRSLEAPRSPSSPASSTASLTRWGDMWIRGVQRYRWPPAAGHCIHICFSMQERVRRVPDVPGRAAPSASRRPRAAAKAGGAEPLARSRPAAARRDSGAPVAVGTPSDARAHGRLGAAPSRLAEMSARPGSGIALTPTSPRPCERSTIQTPLRFLRQPASTAEPGPAAERAGQIVTAVQRTQRLRALRVNSLRARPPSAAFRRTRLIPCRARRTRVRVKLAAAPHRPAREHPMR